jgi:hypothetical protein
MSDRMRDRVRDRDNLSTTFLVDIRFIEALFIIVLGWILVALWQRFIDNLTFNTLGLNENSAYHTFIIALVATIVFVIFILLFPEIQSGFVDSDAGLAPPPISNLVPETPPTPLDPPFDPTPAPLDPPFDPSPVPLDPFFPEDPLGYLDPFRSEESDVRSEFLHKLHTEYKRSKPSQILNNADKLILL